MTDYVLLSYKRVNGDQSLGDIRCETVDQPPKVVLSFVSLKWEDMMLRYAEVLQENPGAKGIIQRTDRPGLNPFALSDKDLERLRTDPKDWVEKNTFHQTSSSGPKKTKTGNVNAMTALPAAVETMVEVFGDMLFLRAQFRAVEGQDKNIKAIHVECPVRKTFVPIENNWLVFGSEYDNKRVFVELLYVDYGYVKVNTLELLLLGFQEFFIPRKWNPSGANISWADLNKMYEDFEKERNASCKPIPDAPSA